MRVAFLANDRIGLLDGTTISVMRPPGYDELDDVALATAGPPVFASQGHVLRLDGTVIASLGGAIEPGTLALTDDGRVTWRNADGRAQSVPLAGEPSGKAAAAPRCSSSPASTASSPCTRRTPPATACSSSASASCSAAPPALRRRT